MNTLPYSNVNNEPVFFNQREISAGANKENISKIEWVARQLGYNSVDAFLASAKKRIEAVTLVQSTSAPQSPL